MADNPKWLPGPLEAVIGYLKNIVIFGRDDGAYSRQAAIIDVHKAMNERDRMRATLLVLQELSQDSTVSEVRELARVALRTSLRTAPFIPKNIPTKDMPK